MGGGTSVSPMFPIRQTGLSPRGRGNPSLSGIMWKSDLLGLSPRGRGNLSLTETPLYARVYPRVGGGTLTRILVIGARVYPRVGGGTDVKSTIGITGLSPRGRGNRSRWGTVSTCHQGVYPRVGGGTSQNPPLWGCRTEVYPRVGGGDNPRPQKPERSIPAWAGEPI